MTQPILLLLLLVHAPWVGAEATEPFERMVLDGALDVTIAHADRPNVTVLGGEALLARTTVEVSDGVLYVSAPRDERVTLLVELDQLVELVSRGSAQVRAFKVGGEQLVIESTGAGQFEFDQLDVHELALYGQGAAIFRMSGSADRQIIQLDGAGQVEAQALVTRSSEVSVRGTGEVALQALEHLQVDVAGSARVYYTGAPHVARQIRGAGLIQAVR